jgi:hypothetical protein
MLRRGPAGPEPNSTVPMTPAPIAALSRCTVIRCEPRTPG